MQIAYKRETGMSLFDSRGNLEAMSKLANLITRLQDSKDMDIRTPLGKADILGEALQIVLGWFEIQNLGVRKVSEEFTSRFCEDFVKEKEKPKLELGEGIKENTRIIPLYAPSNSMENYLRFSEDYQGVKLTTNVYYLLYADTKGNPLRFKVSSKIKGYMIEFPHEVEVSTLSKQGVIYCMGEHPLLLDWCLRNLIQAAEWAQIRSYQRVLEAQSMILSIKTIGELARRSDLTASIFLFHELGPMTSRDDLITAFRRIVEMAGDSPEERIERFETVVKQFNWKNLVNLSRLPLEVTMAVIRGEQVG